MEFKLGKQECDDMQGWGHWAGGRHSGWAEQLFMNKVSVEVRYEWWLGSGILGSSWR